VLKNRRKNLLANLKRLASKADEIVQVESPVSVKEKNSRSIDYLLLEPKKFAHKFREIIHQTVIFSIKSDPYHLQLNTCTNPFCKWFGLPQKKFESTKKKPSRYRLSGSSAYGGQTLICNEDPIGITSGMTWNCTSVPVSNWSVAEEIARLVKQDSVLDWMLEYEFHRNHCSKDDTTPFTHPKDFHKRGKSSSNSQKWKCKTCKKMTNVLPKQRETFKYHQKRNDILPVFANLVLNRTPVKRTCEILKIGSKTYYNKLEWLYRRCLEFLERHEQNVFANKKFDFVWLNTDKMTYYLNNVRRKGQSDGRYVNLLEKQFQTNIVISSDVFSRYVFRADVAFDPNITFEDIERDTQLYKDDHLHEPASKKC
jgi:transposase-like protein